MASNFERVGKDWTENEIVVTVFLYRFGWEDLGVSYADLGKIMGRKSSTIFYRFANFLSVDGVESGLSGGGQLARNLYLRYRTIHRDELRQMAVQALVWMARDL